MKNLVSVKGVRNKILIQVDAQAKPENIVKAIDDKLSEEDKEVWRNSSIILNTGDIVLSSDSLRDIRKLLEGEYRMYISELQSSSEDTCVTGKRMGWAVSQEIQRTVKQSPETAQTKHTSKKQTEYIRETIRSGRRIDASGSVVVVGDVNAGAEIYAGGDVIVFGNLRGSVFAGGNGDKASIIAALKMEPVQIGIVSCISRSPDRIENLDKNLQEFFYPEIARIDNEQIVIESFRTI